MAFFQEMVQGVLIPEQIIYFDSSWGYTVIPYPLIDGISIPNPPQTRKLQKKTDSRAIFDKS